jgi:NAD(P)-dependent dehydrogenase (short-subunit alcohol dehydrogenase family)
MTKGAALITGATGDVGKAIALALAATGRSLALVGRDATALAAVAEQCRAARGAAAAGEAPAVVAVTADLLDPASPGAAVAAAREAVGPVGVLVNAAGVFGPLAPLATSEPDAWAAALQVNVLAAYRFTRALVPDMVCRRSGRVVNVSSLASLSVPTALNSAYATSKVALNAWTAVLALELADTGVTVNALHPGDLKSRMWEEIRDGAGRQAADGFKTWAEHVGATGGDDPGACGRFVAQLVDDPSEPTGRLFLLGAQAQRFDLSPRFSLTPVPVSG